MISQEEDCFALYLQVYCVPFSSENRQLPLRPPRELPALLGHQQLVADLLVQQKTQNTSLIEYRNNIAGNHKIDCNIPDSFTADHDVTTEIEEVQLKEKFLFL